MSKHSLTFLTSYFLIIPAIAAIPPPSADFCLSVRTPPNTPNFPPSTTIVRISASIQPKEEGDLHREERGGMMVGFSIGGRGVIWWWWWWWTGVLWWHDDVSYSLDGISSLHDSDHLSCYCIPSLIRKFGQIYSNVYKGILDGVGLLLNKLDETFFVGGRPRQTVHGVNEPIKIFTYIELEMKLSSGCLLCCYLFRFFHFSPILSHLSTLVHFNSGEVDSQSWIRVPTGVGVLIWQFYLLLLKYNHSLSIHLLNREDSLILHCIICFRPEKNVSWWLLSTTLCSDDHLRVVGPCHLQLNRCNLVFCNLIDAFWRCLDGGYTFLELPILGEPGNRIIPLRESGIRFPRTRIIPLRGLSGFRVPPGLVVPEMCSLRPNIFKRHQ